MTFRKDVANLYVRGTQIARIYSDSVIEIRALLLNCEEADELRKWLDQAIERPRMETPVECPKADGKYVLCYDCPPVGYPTNETRCSVCPRLNRGVTHE